MVIFETDRIILRDLSLTDSEAYFEMMGNPNVMNMVPVPVMSRKESDEHLLKAISGELKKLRKVVLYAAELKSSNEFIGIAAYLINDQEENELGYRLLEKFWRQGYGTEIAKGLIDYGFSTLNFDLITADCDQKNLGSARILERLMATKTEYYSEKYKCNDFRFYLKRAEWEKIQS